MTAPRSRPMIDAGSVTGQPFGPVLRETVGRPTDSEGDMAPTRIFALEEAERTLPLLRRILGDLQAEYDQWREAVSEYELLAGGSRADLGETPELIAAQDAVSASAHKINGFLLEIEAIGCLFKGFDEGLVDFYAIKDDRLVFLCWKLGEEHLGHWHEVDAGFVGRQPIDASEFTAIVP